MIALAEVAAAHGGLYMTHLRDEGPRLVEAVEEAIRVGREAGLPVHINHLKSGHTECLPNIPSNFR